MGALLLIGCLLVAYSLPTAIFLLMMVRKAQLVIVMMARSEHTGEGEGGGRGVSVIGSPGGTRQRTHTVHGA